MENTKIKLRAWDTELKCMVDETAYILSFAGCPFFDNKGDIIEQTEKLVLMQYTGLKDKNGKEIYDGDILKVRVKHGFHSELLDEFKNKNKLKSINGIGLHFTGVVRIDFLRGLMFEDFHSKYREPMFSRLSKTTRYHSDILVIGNIYQHAHLLTAKQ